MEELLNAVVKALSDSPQLAIWVLVIIYLYKTLVLGSIFGVAKLFIVKCHDAWVSPRKVDCSAEINGMVIESGADTCVEALRLLRQTRDRTTRLNYLHAADFEWLMQAIKEKAERDRT